MEPLRSETKYKSAGMFFSELPSRVILGQDTMLISLGRATRATPITQRIYRQEPFTFTRR